MNARVFYVDTLSPLGSSAFILFALFPTVYTPVTECLPFPTLLCLSSPVLQALQFVLAFEALWASSVRVTLLCNSPNLLCCFEHS